MIKNDLLAEARKRVLIDINYEEAISLLEKVEDIEDYKLFSNTLGLAYLEIGQYKKAADTFRNINEKYQAGFCELLAGNEEGAKRLWESAPDSPTCRWGKCLLDYIKLRKGPIPTFLQVRNHLETDLGYLIQANKLKYAENLMKCDDILVSVNLETYKLIGRVMLNFGFLNQAKKYFIKSLGVIPEDAETHYYLGRYYYQTGAYRESMDAFKKALERNANHTPSVKLLEMVKSEIK